MEIDGLQESLKDMKFSQPFEENAIRQAKKNTRPAKSGTGSAYAQSIYDLSIPARLASWPTLRSTLSF